MKTDEAQIERRAEERGEMKADIKYLIVAVDSIKNTVGNLDCKKNSEIIATLKIDYDDRKEEKKVIKHHIFKTLISNTFKAIPWVFGLGGVAYALIK